MTGEGSRGDAGARHPGRDHAGRSTLSVRTVWSECARIVGRAPLVLAGPAFVVAAAADALTLCAAHPVAEVAVGVAIFVLFELYVAYVEHVLIELERGGSPVALAPVLVGTLASAVAIIAAATPAAIVELIASGLLLVPGIWLLTRWSLAGSVIACERVGPLRALARSNALVRGRTLRVFATATVAALVQSAVIDVTAIGDDPLFGSLAAALVVSALVAAVVTPPAAVITSVVYERLTAARDGG
jgi:hypothetical protein